MTSGHGKTPLGRVRFTRGRTLQELIALWLVEFFSLEGKRLRNKSLLESTIHEITGIANNALRGDPLSNLSIKERRSWAERRNTTIEEDEAYCLIEIFGVSIVPKYGERRDQAFGRLEKEISRPVYAIHGCGLKPHPASFLVSAPVSCFIQNHG